ncbi:MAG TPA: GDSL-type esterase/lipase family protein, partial [Pyrinomonadaceae bacterium]
MRNYRFSLLLVLLLLATACGDNGSRPVASEPAPNNAPSAPPSPVKSLPKIVAFGDSLTAGLGLSAAESYPSLLQKRLEADGYRYEVVNAGVSGDTSAGG